MLFIIKKYQYPKSAQTEDKTISLNFDIMTENRKKHKYSFTLWYRGFYDTMYSRSIFTNCRHHFI